MLRVAFRKRAPGFASGFIRFWTGGRFSHVELVFSDGVCFSSSATDGGTRFRELDLNPEEWEFVPVQLSPDVEARVREFCKAEEGCRYDWRGIGFSFLPIPIGWQHAEKWFCSEVCTAALQVAGYLRGYTPASLSPNGMHKKLVAEVSAGKGA